jgi:hypothetical protein
MTLGFRISDSLRKEDAQLADALDAVRRAAYDIWEFPHLRFYTDHRAQLHSEAVLRILEHMLEELQKTSDRLNAQELFILGAACYLHDIAMQDMRVGDTVVDTLTHDDYETIRRRHPSLGARLIRESTVRTERGDLSLPLLRRLNLVEVLAEVVHAHGSEEFDPAVSRLRNIGGMLDGHRCRGDLLAALLMIADELHIGERRAELPMATPLSPLSELHVYANHYVVNVTTESVDPTPVAQRVRVTFQFPEGSDDYSGRVVEWICGKLVTQLRRVSPIIYRGTGGRLLLEEQVDYRVLPSSRVRALLGPAARLLLERDLERRRQVNRDDLYPALERTWKNRGRYEGVAIINLPESDWIQVARRIDVEARAAESTVVSVSLDQTIGHDIRGLLDTFIRQLDATPPRAPDLDALGFVIRERSPVQRLVFVLHHPDNADRRTQAWMRDELIPFLSGFPIGLIVVVREDARDGSGHGSTGLVSGFTTFRLSPYTYEHVLAYCKTRLGFRGEKAEDLARSVHQAGNGQPEKILDRFEVDMWLPIKSLPTVAA